MRNDAPVAYSQLPRILAQRRLSVSDLKGRLKAAGVTVNQKSLYRLTSFAPLQKIDTRIVGAICQTCAVGIEDIISFEPPKPVLEKLNEMEQSELEQLMDKNNEGQLTPSELQRYDELSDKVFDLTMTNARLLAAQRRSLKSTRHPRRSSPARISRNGKR